MVRFLPAGTPEGTGYVATFLHGGHNPLFKLDNQIRSEKWVTERIVQKQNSRSMPLSATSTLSDPGHPTVLLSLSLPAAKATASPRNANESLGSSIPAVAGAASLWEWQMCYSS